MPLLCNAATCSLATPYLYRNRRHAVRQTLHRPGTYNASVEAVSHSRWDEILGGCGANLNNNTATAQFSHASNLCS
jgi:hypothetical protein